MMNVPRRGKLADITKGGQAALDDAVAPVLPKEAQPWYRGVHSRRPADKHEVRDLPEPVLNAVYAGIIVINGPKGGGMQWRSIRLKPEDQDDPDNLAEWAVTDPWGDVHFVVKMSERGLHRNITAYRQRIGDEIAAGKVYGSFWWARKLCSIIRSTLLPGEWTNG